jgi:hypothetical protein
MLTYFKYITTDDQIYLDFFKPVSTTLYLTSEQTQPVCIKKRPIIVFRKIIYIWRETSQHCVDKTQDLWLCAGIYWVNDN